MENTFPHLYVEKSLVFFKLERVPTTKTIKEEIKAWLRGKNVDFPEDI